MNTSHHSLKGVVLLFTGIAVLAVVGCKPETPPAGVSQSGAQLSPIQTPIPAATMPVPGQPLPTVVLTDWAPGTPIVLQEGKDVHLPTVTPWPTTTPRPTPTRGPGPAFTAMPLPTPAGDPSGEIWFTTRAGIFPQAKTTTHVLHIDAHGQPTGSTESLVWPKSMAFSSTVVYPSPDNRYAVVLQSVEPGGRPHVVNRLTGEVKTLFESLHGGSFFGWHPNGRHFLFWIDGSGMWLIDAETSETTTLVYPEGPIQGAAISPNGMLIAYIDSYRPKSLGSLWFVSSAGSDASPTVDVGMGYIYPGAWSPDGNRLVYYGECGETLDKRPLSGPLCLLDVHTRQQIALNAPYAGFEPVWSPDNRQIAFTGLIPNEKSCNAQPEMSAAEYEMCWYKTSGVFILDTKTNESRFLTRGVAPAWSPDGSALVFLSDQSGATELWTIRSDGSSLRQLTTDEQFKSPYSHLTWLREVKK